MSRSRIILVVAAVVVLVLLLLAQREPPPVVTAAVAHRENLSASISSNGKVEPVTPYVLRVQFATLVERILANEGQNVKAGQRLVELQSAEMEARLARARQEMVTAQENLRAARAGGTPEEIAQLESDRRKNDAELSRLRREREALERLVAKQAATRDELDQNKLALDRAEAQARLLQEKKQELARRAALDVERATLALERSQSEVRDLEAKVRSAHAVAPVNGTVYALPVRPGDFVETGALLAEIADLRQVRVRAFVDEPELGGLEDGQAVEITWDAMPGRVWNGRIVQVPKAVESRGTRSVGVVLISIANDKLELLPNTNVNVRIRVSERANALVVPRAAVRADGGRRYVFVVDGGTLRRREVRVGIAGATMYEILEGLRDGERVALPGAVELRDGLAARIEDQK